MIPNVERYEPNLAPRGELAYLIGFYLGDGSRAGGQKKVRFKLVDSEQTHFLNRLVARVLSTKPRRIRTDGHFCFINYDTALLYDFLQKPLDELRPWIEPYSRDFLRGFFDAEGYTSPSIDRRRRAFVGACFGVANTNLGLLRFVRDLLIRLGISTRLRITNREGQSMRVQGGVYVRRHDVYHLISNRKQNLITFNARVGFQMRKKEEKLRDLVELSTWEDRRSAYEWFASNYEMVNHRWSKRTRRSPRFIRRNHGGSTKYEASPGGRNFPGSDFASIPLNRRHSMSDYDTPVSVVA